MRHKQEYGIVVNLRRIFFFFSSRRRHTRYWRDWSSDVCSSDLEGICGSCSLMINGVAHGPMPGTATCQLHMRSFRDGDIIVVEPWRARAFPVIRDLCVDRGALDRIIAAGGDASAATAGGRSEERDFGLEARGR